MILCIPKKMYFYFVRHLQELEVRIRNLIEQVSDDGVFVRFGARSPKDSGFQNQRMKNILNMKLKQLDKGTPHHF